MARLTFGRRTNTRGGYNRGGRVTKDGPKFLGRKGGATQASARSGKRTTRGRLGKYPR